MEGRKIIIYRLLLAIYVFLAVHTAHARGELGYAISSIFCLMERESIGPRTFNELYNLESVLTRHTTSPEHLCYKNVLRWTATGGKLELSRQQ